MSTISAMALFVDIMFLISNSTPTSLGQFGCGHDSRHLKDFQMRAQEALIFAAFKGVSHLADIHTDDGRERLLNDLEKAAEDLRKLGSEAYLLRKIELAQISIEGLIAAHGEVETIIANDVPLPRLAAWEITESPSGYPLLQGLAFGHPRLTGFARPIVTSLLLYIDMSQGYARTLSRWYRLLTPQPSVYDA